MWGDDDDDDDGCGSVFDSVFAHKRDSSGLPPQGQTRTEDSPALKKLRKSNDDSPSGPNKPSSNAAVETSPPTSGGSAGTSLQLSHSFLRGFSSAEDAMTALRSGATFESPASSDLRHSFVHWTIKLSCHESAGDFVGVFLKSTFRGETSPDLPQYFSISMQRTTADGEAARIESPRAHFVFAGHDLSTCEQGFPRFFSLDDCRKCWSQHGGIIVNVQLQDSFDTLGVIQASRSDSQLDHGTNFHAPVTDANTVGILNQGATCYMNALLQVLFNLPGFSRPLLGFDTSSDAAETSILLGLQRVFVQLLTSRKAISTRRLTQAFGWDSLESFVQHDAQELARILLDRVQKRIRARCVQAVGSSGGALDFVASLFQGEMETQLRCLHVDATSTKKEIFFDIQLDVPLEAPSTGAAIAPWSLKSALDKYTAVELLDGDNQYFNEKHGKQDAEKKIRFVSLPPVLQLHLKRFQCQPSTGDLVKVNSAFLYPETLDMSAYCVPRTTNVCSTYRLYSVIVHQGSIYNGHYFAYVRRRSKIQGADSSSKWFCFNDAEVKVVDLDAVLQKNIGHSVCTQQNSALKLQPQPPTAYVLMYIRDDASELLLNPLCKDDVPVALRERLSTEVAEQKAREEANLRKHLEITVHYFTFQDQVTKFKTWKDLSNIQHMFSECACPTIKCLRSDTLDHVRRAIEHDIVSRTGRKLGGLDLWSTCIRSNGSHRVFEKLSAADSMMTLEVLEPQLSTRQGLFFCAVDPTTHDGERSSSDSDILIFLQRFQPTRSCNWPTNNDKVTIDPSGLAITDCISIASDATVAVLKKRLRDLNGVGLDIDIRIWEVNTVDRLDLLDNDMEELGDNGANLVSGDLLCFQIDEDIDSDSEDGDDHGSNRSSSVLAPLLPKIPALSMATDAYAFLADTFVLRLCQRSHPNVTVRRIRVRNSLTYSELSSIVGYSLDVIPHVDRLRFTAHNWLTNQPQRDPLKLSQWAASGTLKEMVFGSDIDTRSNEEGVVYYELLKVSLASIEGKLKLDIRVPEALYSSANLPSKTLSVYVDPNASLREVLQAICEEMVNESVTGNEVEPRQLQLCRISEGLCRVDGVINDTCSASDMRIMPGAASHLYVFTTASSAPIPTVVESCENHSLLLIHFGFIYPLPTTTSNDSNDTSAATYNPNETIVFSKAPVVAHTGSRESVASFLARLDLSCVHVNLQRPGFQNTLRLTIIDKADRVTKVLSGKDVLAEHCHGTPAHLRIAMLHPYFRATAHLTGASQGLTMRE